MKVFTTVGTPEKKEFIKRQFPQINERHIGNTRNTSFEQMVLSETQGNGVDFVLNSHGKDTYLDSLLRCLSPEGHFLEIGSLDVDKSTKLGMKLLQQEVNFHGIVLEKCLESEYKCKILHNLLKEAIKKGVVKPLQRNVFSEDNIIDAFQHMSTGKHMGKVLIKLQDEFSPKINLLKCHPR